MEAASLNDLPPSKRYKLFMQQEDEKRCLPAKKRTNHHHHLPITTTICLPAKKRIFPPHPLSPIKYHLDDHLPIEANTPKIQPPPLPLIERFDLEQEDDDDGIMCAVCGSTDAEANDPIVFCDGCDLMVHSSCYGNPLAQSIPDGDWFCLSCEKKKDDGEDANPTCCLCPVKGGALKPTKDGRWAHILCALLVPETFFHDPPGRDGIDCSRVPVCRWKRSCYLCDSIHGCAIECSEPRCDLWFHVSCGIEGGLCIEYKEGKGAGGSIVAGFCSDHTELWKKQQLTGKYKIVSREHDLKRKARN